jgi:hypothetical protein
MRRNSSTLFADIDVTIARGAALRKHTTDAPAYPEGLGFRGHSCS